jgi:hypothetical protein
MTEPSSFLLMVYKRALLLYPPRLRRKYQQQMLQTLLDAHREERPGSRRFWLKIYTDLLQSAFYERIFMLREQVLKQPIFFHALCLGLILTFLGGTAAVAFQRMLRRGANQPQIEMAKFYASEIGSGEEPDNIIPPGYVDPERSLEPFVIFYDDQGRPEKATGYLDQSAPVPPLSVFEYSRSHGSDAFTWQPRPQVRIATVPNENPVRRTGRRRRPRNHESRAGLCQIFESVNEIRRGSHEQREQFGRIFPEDLAEVAP